MSRDVALDLGAFVHSMAAERLLVVQPRMGIAPAAEMTDGIQAVAELPVPTAATITLDSYTRVGDHDSARRALAGGGNLNGFPIVVHGPEVTAEVAAGAAHRAPVQVRHGSAAPASIFTTMAAAGLSASEGGPVSYCLPYGRTPLAESVARWGDATQQLVEDCQQRGMRAHLETFGGCLLGQLCPPSLLVAMSVLEAMFFVRHGAASVSLSYAQQTNPVQDIEALAALRQLAEEMLPESTDWHLVLYAYMGVYPSTIEGAQLLLDTSAEIATRGNAERLIVKTSAEAHRIPDVPENLAALRAAANCAAEARQNSSLPWVGQVDHSTVLEEARALVAATLAQADDIGSALHQAFGRGLLDVPFCLHADNRGLAQGGIDGNGRLIWANVGDLALPSRTRVSSDGITSSELLRMLRFTADQHDRAVLATPSREDAGQVDAAPHRVAIVGSGPRGVAVLERMVARLAEETQAEPVEIDLIDAVEVGCGRIWHTDQPPWLLMNTSAGEVTMFSGPPDEGPARPGAGPSLAQWWSDVEPERADPYGYAPRALYGRYLQFVVDSIEAAAPTCVSLQRRRARVDDLRREPDRRWRLVMANDAEMLADRVVLTTGHSLPALAGEQRRLADFTRGRPQLRYLRGDSATDMPLDDIPASATVGVIGMGLSFYDVMAALSIGRGGRFADDDAGRLRYLPSGDEPTLVAGSRSGAPIPARGRNQKSSDHSYRPLLFTRDRIHRARSAGRLDFHSDVYPLLLAEVELVYYSTAARQRYNATIADLLVEEILERAQDTTDPRSALAHEVPRFGLDDLPPVDLQRWARPFTGHHFGSPAEFDAALATWIRADLAEAALGNVDGPAKAALDALRDVRSVIRAAVDFGGLTPSSHQAEFLGEFVPLSSFLSAGPPAERLRQLRALMDCRLFRSIGPRARFTTGHHGDRFHLCSPDVDGSSTDVDVVIDARVPAPDVRADTSRLTRRLYRRGTVTSYRNTDGPATFDTGGVAVTSAPYHPIGTQGVEDGLYVLGIPTEHTRWFTQVGSGRPGAWNGFTADADAIATHVLTRQPNLAEQTETV